MYSGGTLLPLHIAVARRLWAIMDTVRHAGLAVKEGPSDGHRLPNIHGAE